MSNNNLIEMQNLIDIYGNLLTKKQLQYAKDYYFNNLTLAEIAENERVSKQAVDFAIKNATKILLELDEKLMLSSKFGKLFELSEKCPKDLSEKIIKIIND